jgi:hypothetical protein
VRQEQGGERSDGNSSALELAYGADAAVDQQMLGPYVHEQGGGIRWRDIPSRRRPQERHGELLPAERIATAYANGSRHPH